MIWRLFGGPCLIDTDHGIHETGLMWSVEAIDIEASTVELDFSSSGQGRRASTAVSAAGIRLFNAIELVDVDPSATQVEVCECCGVPQCAPGGWVAFRRIGERVVWVPAWDEMENGRWAMSEYSPPAFLQSRGAPVFSAPAWDRLRALQSGLPDAHALPQINSREAARLCQWAAPGRVLGTFPDVPRTRRDLLVAVSDGDVGTEAECVDQCLRDHYEAKHAMELVPHDAPVAPIEFWLDLPGTPSWKRFGHLDGQTCFLIDGGLALVCGGGLTSGGQ
jgi:hypothetical protein